MDQTIPVRKVKPVFAIKEFFGKDSRPVESTEVITFWKSLNLEEKAYFPQECAKALGVELELA